MNISLKELISIPFFEVGEYFFRLKEKRKIGMKQHAKEKRKPEVSAPISSIKLRKNKVEAEENKKPEDRSLSFSTPKVILINLLY